MSMIISSQDLQEEKIGERQKAKDNKLLFFMTKYINTAKYRQTYFLWILSEGKSRMEEEGS